MGCMGQCLLRHGHHYYRYSHTFKYRSIIFIKGSTITKVTLNLPLLVTVGYGDMGPVSDEAKWFTIFFIIVGIVVIAGALGIIGRFFIDQANKLIWSQ